MDRLDTYNALPPAMGEYLSAYGWHFSKKLCECACKAMKDRNGQKHTMKSKEDVDAELKAQGIELKNDKGYDACYVFNMAVSDYYGSSLQDKASIAKFVKDYLDDLDGTPTRAMDEYVGRCIGAGCPIIWEDVI